MVETRLPPATALLDMGTGGGEFLASLAPLPAQTSATEAWPPNIPVAIKRLEPLGVTVIPVEEYAPLPLPDAAFDLVINRHEWYDPAEVYRILKPGGVFLTQQVGKEDCIAINEALSAPHPEGYDGTNFVDEVAAVEQAGFELLQVQEAFPLTQFFDVGALVYYLKIIEWQIPDFSVETYRDKLLELHHAIEAGKPLEAHSHRTLIEALKV